MKDKNDNEQLTLIDEETDEKLSKGLKSSGGLFDDNILTESVEHVLHNSMIPYSEHVILDRALPRVEDGLKPVQRRILYTMLDLGITPDKPFRKSARIVGDCLGKYHPHGDSSVYDAMVRMAQNFNMRETLVEGHGNFGSVDGDSAAAMRYTEARLTPLAMELLKDLEKNTVSWSFNFDDTLKEPDMLPAGFPNLLVNGSMGIAVGLATNIPTHNLNEVIDACTLLIDKPKAKLDEVMKVMPAPDFPTGGYLIGGEELKQAYETGKGKITIRSKINIETEGDKKTIVITELPYQVNKAMLLAKIAELKEDKGKSNLAGIAEIRDESDRNGMRAVIKLKKEVDPQPILAYLYKYTNLQTQFNFNMVAIADGKPKQMGVIEMLKYYITYRQGVILRRTKYDLDIAKERAHILEGLLIAIKNIDAIIKIIKSSPNTTEAKVRLKAKFNFSEKQAQAILDMRLAKLTNLESFKIEQELKELKERIKYLSEIVASPKRQLQVVKEELGQVKRAFKGGRRSKIKSEKELVEIENEPEVQIVKDVVLAISANGFIKAIPKKNYSMAQKEFNDNGTLNEVHTLLCEGSSDKTAYIITNFGNCFKLPIMNIDECKFKDKGTLLGKLLPLEHNEKAVFIGAYNTLPKNQLLYLFTKDGTVKCSKLGDYNIGKPQFDAIALKDGDEVVSACLEQNGLDRMILVTAQGMVLSAEISDVKPIGRVSQGVKAIELNDGDYVVFASLANDEGEIITVTDKAYAKRTIIASLGEELSKRARKGIKITSLHKDNGEKLVFASIVKMPYTIVVKDINGIIIPKFSEDIVIQHDRVAGLGKSVTRSKNGLVVDFVSVYNT
ncbi:MAG: DNA topoisomerase 4 subunit A [Clostridia bacterium]|nr:DNA topoisomerase 4 subunit A [Clostridia bacterium]